MRNVQTQRFQNKSDAKKIYLTDVIYRVIVNEKMPQYSHNPRY